jgi:dTDP-4-amino-4,6-dideoxygalactose transaminase
MKVPFVDLAGQHEEITEELHEVFTRVLERSSFVLGSEVERFEDDFAAYLKAPYCVAVNSGTAALHLTLLALGIGPGDEVITVANTFIATAEAISAVGAIPVFVDVDPFSYNMDPAAVESAITPRTKALLPVHLFGQTADIDPLLAIANRHGLVLIEDACQAHGGTYNGKKAGTLGIAGCFSFYPGKNLGGLGEGGAVVTTDPAIAAQIRMLRDHGSVRKYEHQVPGFNFRMEGLQGGFLAVKLKHLDKWNKKRVHAAHKYQELLSGAEVILPRQMPYAGHVYHLYVIQANMRDELRTLLGTAGIETGLHYPIPLHLQVAYKQLGLKIGSFPVSEQLSQRILSLPMHPGITDEQIEYVSSAVMESSRSLKKTAQKMAV